MHYRGFGSPLPKKPPWLDPASVLKMKSDVAQAGAPPAAAAGDAWVVNNWGGGYTDGDIVEYDGAAWNVIVANAGGFPPAGTRAVVISAGAAGSFTGEENNVGIADGGGTWYFDIPVDGNCIVIKGENSIYENEGYVFDAGSWVQIIGLIPPHNSTTGIQGGSTTERYHLTLDEYNEALKYKASNGAMLRAYSITEEVTIAVGEGAAGKVSATNLAPAGSSIVGVAFRVTQAPGGGATTLSIGRTSYGNLDEFIQTKACAALGNTGELFTDHDAFTTSPVFNDTVDTFTLTTNANVTISDMKVRVVVFYQQITVPTS